MNKILEWMEKHFIPVAAKIGSQRHLVAIRDAFIAIMPITMVGSVAVLLNVFLRDLPTANKMQGVVDFFQPVIAVNGNVYLRHLRSYHLRLLFLLDIKLLMIIKLTQLLVL